jgi:hypothetical protein
MSDLNHGDLPMRFILAILLFLLATPAMASPVCGVVESLARLAMGHRQMGQTEDAARAQFRNTNFRNQTALALVADFLVTEAYRSPVATPDQRLAVIREFGQHHHELCLELAP